MNRPFVIVGLMAALAGSPASAKEQPGQRFITKAIEGNLAETALGQLAQQKGASDGVRNFGQQLATDHTAANQRATAVATQMGVTPPTEPNKKQKATYDRMSKLSGGAFDRQFVKHMVDDQNIRKRPDAERSGRRLRQRDSADATAAPADRAGVSQGATSPVGSRPSHCRVPTAELLSVLAPR